MAPKKTADKRRNRVVPLAEAMTGMLDPVLKKRGFASRDLLAHWASMAPAPYDRVAMPDRLAWPRSEKGQGTGGGSHEGATLYLRCMAGHQLALAHEGERIASAINRYYGYLLVGQVRLSATPMSEPPRPPPPRAPAAPEALQRLAQRLEVVEDEGLREALRLLGEGVVRQGPRN
ncbi:MAG: DUF721 domain-containing protein [Devosia sp.]